jgi:hypothetical protein
MENTPLNEHGPLSAGVNRRKFIQRTAGTALIFGVSGFTTTVLASSGSGCTGCTKTDVSATATGTARSWCDSAGASGACVLVNFSTTPYTVDRAKTCAGISAGAGAAVPGNPNVVCVWRRGGT